MNLDEKFQPTDDIRRINWLKYFRRIADLYGLKDWVIEMGNDEPTQREANVSCFIGAGRKLAWMRISQTFIEETIEAQRLCVVHELTHCHDSLSYNFAQTHLPEHHKDTHTILMELSIDGISTVIAKYFPLPTEEERGCSN